MRLLAPKAPAISDDLLASLNRQLRPDIQVKSILARGGLLLIPHAANDGKAA